MLFCSPAFAENKIYFDSVENKEIVDLSGVMDVEEIRKESGLGNLVDITQERLAVKEKNKALAQKESEKEKLIQEEIRETAVKNLKIKGKFDADGNVKKDN